MISIHSSRRPLSSSIVLIFAVLITFFLSPTIQSFLPQCTTHFLKIKLNYFAILDSIRFTSNSINCKFYSQRKNLFTCNSHPIGELVYDLLILNDYFSHFVKINIPHFQCIPLLLQRNVTMEFHHPTNSPYNATIHISR